MPTAGAPKKDAGGMNGRRTVQLSCYRLASVDFPPPHPCPHVHTHVARVQALPAPTTAQAPRWVDAYGGGVDQSYAYAYAVAVYNNVSYSTGAFQGRMEVTLANGTTVALTSNSGTTDIYVLELDATGRAAWVRRFGGGSFNSDYGSGIAVDSSGASYTTGVFVGSMPVTLANGTTITLVSSDGSYEIFAIKLDTSGGAGWARAVGGTDDQYARAIAVDSSNNSYVTGYFNSNMEVTLVNGTTVTLTANSIFDVFALKLNTAGGAVWAQRFGGDGYVYGGRLCGQHGRAAGQRLHRDPRLHLQRHVRAQIGLERGRAVAFQRHDPSL